jgi:hypothetical protein
MSQPDRRPKDCNPPEMRINPRCEMRCWQRLVMIASLILAGCHHAPRASTSDLATPSSATAQAPVQSGVYGFSGAGTPLGAPEGVIGECVWIFDASDRKQVAKGDCAEKDPGSFRIALKPGHYVLHGPGGNHPFHVQAGRWVKVESVASLPIAP